MSSSINQQKTLRHVRNYVFPYLTEEQREESIKSLGIEIPTDTNKLEGEFTVGLKYNNLKEGMRIKALGLLKEGITVHLITEKGNIPLSKVQKPFKMPLKTKAGFDVEKKIAKNLGVNHAGPSQHEFDFHYPPSPLAKKIVFGKVKTTEDAPETVVRGESKLDRGKFGESALIFNDKKKTWMMSNDKMSSKFSQAKKNNLTIIDYLNKNHPEGKIEQGFSVQAPKGTAGHYLEQSKVNVLHLHDKKSNTGTTYTIGNKNELKGQTKLAHLSTAQINQLDGSISVEKTQTGRTVIVHKPKQGVMKKFANKSTEDPIKHRSLYDPEHANEFRHHVNTFITNKDKELNNIANGTDKEFYNEKEF